jgi:uncharacterized membrane protein
MDGQTINYANSILGYEPSQAASIVCLVLFFVLGAVVLGLNLKFKSWFFMSLVVAAILEVIGLAFRVEVKEKPFSIPIYIGYSLPVLVAPTIFAIADYALVSRM